MLVAPSVPQALTVMRPLESTMTEYLVRAAVPLESTGIDLRYLTKGVVKSTQSPVAATLHPPVVIVHPLVAVPNCFSAIPAVRPLGRVPLLSTIDAWIAVRIVSTSLVLLASRESLNRWVGLRATKTNTAKTPMMPITKRSSIKVNPFFSLGISTTVLDFLPACQ